ncbi:Retrovirus-related Pol polyprotein from transposon 17.6, partial [Mucuna pruriens]
MQKEVEVYVNDMIAKSKMLGQHINDLCKLFERPQKYQPRLNPTKCTFGVRTGKLLGFIVNKRGIELDLDKVKAIRNISALKTETEVSGFLGRVSYIARFISQLMGTCKAFEKVKQYLESPRVLVPIIPSKPLILYLIVLKESMGGILRQQDDSGKEKVIYYLSKKFIECEYRYPALEQICCALVWAAKRLRPPQVYFRKADTNKMDRRWQMALSKYDIVYTNEKAIKGSTLAEQLAHHPPR